MKKPIKIIIVAIAAVSLLAACGLGFYFGRKISLEDILPQEQWYHISFVNVVFEDSHTAHRRYTVTEDGADELMEALCGAQAKRYRTFDGSDADYFRIAFCTEDWSGRYYIVGNGPDMWNLYLGEDGLLRVFEPNGDAWYFENCQELYQQLQTLAQTLPLAG